MSWNLIRNLLLVCLISAFAGILESRVARAGEILTIDPNSSVVNLTAQIGLFVDDEGNATYPSGAFAGLSYGPGSINPDDGTPVTFTSVASSVGMGNPTVPKSVLPGGIGDVPGGIVPGFSDGSSAQIIGTMNLSGGTLNATFGLKNSGLWQPSIPFGAQNYTATLPMPAALALYCDASGTIPGEYALAAIAAQSPAFAAKEFSIDIPGVPNNGAFSYSNVPYSQQGLSTYGLAGGPFAATFDNGNGNPSTAIGSGTSITTSNGGKESFSFSTVIYDIVSSDPDLYAQLSFTGNVVATVGVPEPNSLLLAAIGATLAALAYRRKRRLHV